MTESPTNHSEFPVQEMLRSKLATFQFPSSYVDLELSEFSEGLPIPEAANVVQLRMGTEYVYIFRNDISNPKYTHARTQVCRLEIDSECNVINFIADSDKSLVAETFSRLSNLTFFRNIQLRFGIPDLDENARKQANAIAQANNAKAERQKREIDEIKILAQRSSLLPARPVIDVADDELVASIGQAEIGFIQAGNKRYLETLGAGPCIIVTAYDNTSKKGAMSHIDGLTDERGVIRRIIEYAGASAVRVFGGDNSSINQLVSIKEALEQNAANVLEWDVLNTTKSIVLDCETGKVFNVTNPKLRKDATRQDQLMMQLRSFQGKQPAKTKYYVL